MARRFRRSSAPCGPVDEVACARCGDGPPLAGEANRRLVELLVGRRWSVMQAAREHGASWEAIGAALGMSRQGAYDWYTRKIADQEQWATQFHDAGRARAVLDGNEVDPGDPA